MYAASEGSETLVIEREALGGQASTSSRIRNFLGFPTGVSGRDLAERAYEQAWFFGAEFHFMNHATGSIPEPTAIVVLSDSTGLDRRGRPGYGVSYRRFDLPPWRRSSVPACSTARPYPRLPRSAAIGSSWPAVATQRDRPRSTWRSTPTSVTILVRASGLAETMSEYLSPRSGPPRIGCAPRSSRGRPWLGSSAADAARPRKRANRAVTADALFVLIGAARTPTGSPRPYPRSLGLHRDGRDLLRAARYRPVDARPTPAAARDGCCRRVRGRRRSPPFDQTHGLGSR